MVKTVQKLFSNSLNLVRVVRGIIHFAADYYWKITNFGASHHPAVDYFSIKAQVLFYFLLNFTKYL